MTLQTGGMKLLNQVLESSALSSHPEGKREELTLKSFCLPPENCIKIKNWKEITRIKDKISSMLDEDNFGYVIRSRFKNNAVDEMASLYHANHEIKNGKKNSLGKLKMNGINETFVTLLYCL